MQAKKATEDIAIIGIGCRFPGGANTPQQFWKLLSEGIDAITHIPKDRFNVDEVFDPDPEAPGKIYSTWGGFLEQVDKFDADFFGISPREARRMDPQHRLLLEVAWEALVDGGQAPEKIAGTNTGVYIGISSHDYADMHVHPGRRKLLDSHINIGNALCVAANRISFLLDLHGPSFAIESACSSSLTALHLACQSLSTGESELAIVGGVNLILAPELTVGFCKAGMISPDGRCRAFDERANGYVRSEGAGVVILKSLNKAKEEGDPIYAIIRGTAINEDGRTAGISLPNGNAQERLLRQTLEIAGCDASDVQYVEAHGTGTAAGDPIEARALGRVFGASRTTENPCLIGSVKTNVGHLEAGAGMAGLIKTALALKHRKIPPSLHFTQPNPEIPFDQYHLKVTTELINWPATSAPAMAGVNSFGFGGTNAHVILEEPPQVKKPAETLSSQVQLLSISARAPEALADYVKRYKQLLTQEFTPSLNKLCDAAANRQSHYEYRLSVLGRSPEEMVEGLELFQKKEESADVIVGKARKASSTKLAFAFPGMGPQWWAMGRQLFESEPAYRDEMKKCDQILRPIAGWSLIDELNKDENTTRMAQAELAHVANFALQVSLTSLWNSWGVVPDVVVGHSSGEIAAAYVAGALSLKDALHLAYHRGRLQQTLAGTGGMLAAAISPGEAQSLIQGYEEKVSLAAVNSKDAVTLSGKISVLQQIAEKIALDGRFCRILQVDVPYHSPQMKDIRKELLMVLRNIKPKTASLPVVSSVRGNFIRGEDFDGEYWWQNARNPVRFDKAVEVLLEENCNIFLEVGPHPVLSAYLMECLANNKNTAILLPSLRRKENERGMMLRSLARLYVEGYPVLWKGVYTKGTFVSLPSYPWQRERHWIEPMPASMAVSAGVDSGHPLLGNRIHSAQPLWEVNLNDPRTDYLNAHLVENSIVFPGAGYVEMMLSAAGEIWKETPLSLKNIQFHKLLFLEEPRQQVLQCYYNQENNSMEIYSTAENSGAWIHHAGASIREQQNGLLSEKIDLAAIINRCSREVPIEEHFRVMESIGFNYGSAFRGLQRIYVGEGEAIAHISIPDGVKPDGYRVHPALLDAAFQVLIVVATNSLEGDVFSGPIFPVSISEVRYHAAASGNFRAYIRVREGSGSSLMEGDVFLIDDNAKVVMGMEGLRAKLLNETGKEKKNKDKGWCYDFNWEERVTEPVSSKESRLVREAIEIKKLVEATSQAPEEDSDVRLYYDVIVPGLNRIAGIYAFNAMKELGWNCGDLNGWTVDALSDHLGVKQEYKALFAELYRMGVLQFKKEDNQLRSPDNLLEDLKNRAPKYAAECELVKQGGKHLAGMLTGHIDMREVLLSAASLELLSGMYHNSPACRNYHKILADVVASSFSDTKANTTLRIIEIGAGTGAATADILPRLPDNSRYVFTDISPYFPNEARQRLGTENKHEFSVLDIEKDPVSQGYQAHSFDMVVAANVLHTTRDLESSLGHVQQLLKPGGLLVILEITRKADWFNLVFGLLDGWWRFSDSKRRKDSPIIGSCQWKSLLSDCGFRDTTSLFTNANGEEALQTVTFAHTPEENITLPVKKNKDGEVAIQYGPTESKDARQGSWLILADEQGIAQKLAEDLRKQGDRCILAYCGKKYLQHGPDHYHLPVDEPSAISRLFSESGIINDTCKGAIHLWPIDAPAGEMLTSQKLMESQKSVCAALLHLLQKQPENYIPALWLVTSGSQALENGAGTELARVSQATLWGLGRVVSNEFEDISCKLVDLGSAPSQQEIKSLVDLLQGVWEDEEIALRGEKCYVRRLHRLSLEEMEPNLKVRLMSPDTDSFRLEISRPGALENLRLREAESPVPGAGELTIRVHASGLNFQEVLLALDMLPREALPRELESPALGLECAGTVLECGEGVAGFRPGDEVIALASAAHGSRAIARAHLVVHKPENISFVQAASLVNAFVTASYSLHQVAQITEGDRVLIHSATGGVGLAAIRLCKEAGAEIFATAGTAQKRDYLSSLGIEHVMDSRSISFADEVLSHTDGEGVDVVLNSITGHAMEASLNLLRPYGRFVELGKRDIYGNSALGLLPFRKNLSYTAVDLQQMAMDRPDFAKRMIRQVVQDVARGRWEVIPATTFDLAEAENAFRYMAQAKHIGKIVLTLEKSQYPVQLNDKHALWQEQASYLITGGLGGFGLATAQWLADRGVQSLVLMSRSGIPKDDAKHLEQLKESGTRITVIQGDVSKEEDVKRVLGFIRGELPPLKGIIHAAMILDDCAIKNLDTKRLLDVMSPKVAGAWNLHRLTADDELDQFILFSSVASILGHPMQGNYTAANAFLDTLAGYRRQMGLPGLSVGWGAVAGAGYVSRHPEVVQYLNRSGLDGFPPEEGLMTMEKLLGMATAHVLIANITWNRWKYTNPVMASSRRFRDLMEEAGAGTKPTSSETESPLESLRAAAPEKRQEVMNHYLLRKLARVSGSKPDKIDMDRPLTEMGFDSLMAVELTTALNSDLGFKLPVVKILQGINGHELGATLIRQLLLGSADAKMDVGQQVLDKDSIIEVPMSAEQKRFWYLEQLSPGDPALHLVVAARLTGPLDVVSLQKSIQEVVRRHEVLRAVFSSDGGEPKQEIAAPMKVPLPCQDLRDLPSGQRGFELQKLATEEIQKPFDLNGAPLLRALLIQTNDQEYALLMIAHHIASDSWTMALIAKEVMKLYAAYSKGGSSPLPEPPLQYAHYVTLQQEILTPELISGQLNYWRRQLNDGSAGGLNIPTDFPRKPGKRIRGAHIHFSLSQELSDKLRQLSRHEGVTLFVTLLASFQTLLHRYSNDPSISTATPVATKNRAETQELLGCCMNTVVLRNNLSGNPTFREMLHRTRKVSLGAFENQDVPFQRIVEELKPQRGTGYSPLFTNMLILHNIKYPELDMADVSVEPMTIETGAAVSDLTILMDNGVQLRGSFEYNIDIFEEGTAQLMLSQLQHLLEEIVTDPDQRILFLPLISDKENKRLQAQWNDTFASFPEDKCLHHLFEEQARTTPDRSAVVWGEEYLTYQELDLRANQLAHKLRQAGIKPDTIAGIFLERSPEMVVAVLAVLKAGGAYLLLESNLPQARLRLMIEDANPAVLITLEGLLEVLPPNNTTKLLVMDKDERAIYSETSQPVISEVRPDHLAYVVYTSGSTGRPKGVLVTHRAICNQVQWRQSEFTLRGEDAVLQRTPLSFDPSVWEFFGPLSAGARLVLPVAGTEADALSLARTISKFRITSLQLTPGLLEALIDEPAFKECQHLTQVFCGGEPLTSALAERFFNCSNAGLYNMYGPAEAAIDTTCLSCLPNINRVFVPIGKPIANVHVYILDPNGQPLPAGLPGELCIGGAGLAREYLNQAQLTAERFIPHPFSDTPDVRLYRSGDRARRLADGNIEILGRMDDQVKIWGFRVEPGEVEVTLLQHPEVLEAAVVTRRRAVGGNSLLAYIVPEADKVLSVDTLQRYLNQQLPAYMIPSDFQFVEALPRLPSGKVDRRTLSTEITAPSDNGSKYEPPRNKEEERLIHILEGLLELRPLGVTDDFFEMGGHSLLAMRFISAINREFDEQLPVSVLIEGSTVEQLACLLHSKDETEPQSSGSFSGNIVSNRHKMDLKK
jgi:amino acid adenylation domain-containing protein